MAKYPDYIMEIVRQRLDLDESDTSRDTLIESMSKDDILSHVCGWELGYTLWANTMKKWVKDIYDIELK